ncbi:MAG: tRNA lysidine(34) synthetase TilS [Bacteroidales bacterium]|nr:tRNA lysidine(34) synthetase TilS [Bacteroidales bacterium]
MIETFKTFIKENQLFDSNSRILAAVSGGRDSVVLAYLLKEAGYNFSIAHCNFQLRAKESDEDERFVMQFADQQDISCFVKRFETKEYALQNKISIQMAARDLRYEWFQSLCVSHGFDCIAVAHHMDDQSETFFINLIRGSGLTGLKGMKVRNGLIVRPLFFASSEQITAFANEKNIAFRDDSSNSQTKYLRNKIRHRLMPVFTALHENAGQGLQKSLQMLAGNHALYETLLKEKTDKLLKFEGDVCRLEKTKLKAFDASKALLFECISRFGFSGAVISDIHSALFNQPGSVFFTSSHRLIVGHKYIEIDLLQEKQTEDILVIENETQEILEPIKMVFEKIQRDSSFSVKSSSAVAQIDYEKLIFPLTLRHWRQGDRFKPLGMSGTQLLSDFFADKHFSQLQKEQALLLVSGNGDIIWLVGYRLDDRFKITDDTSQILRIKTDEGKIV